MLNANCCLRKRHFVAANKTIYKIYLPSWCIWMWRVSDRFMLDKTSLFISWKNKT